MRVLYNAIIHCLDFLLFALSLVSWQKYLYRLLIPKFIKREEKLDQKRRTKEANKSQLDKKKKKCLQLPKIYYEKATKTKQFSLRELLTCFK